MLPRLLVFWQSWRKVRRMFYCYVSLNFIGVLSDILENAMTTSKVWNPQRDVPLNVDSVS